MPDFRPSNAPVAAGAPPAGPGRIVFHDIREAILQSELWTATWKEVSRPAAIGWVAFYVAFLIYAATNTSGFLFIDSANLVVHEGGHLLFAWFGETLCLWGGTILQWAVPLLLAAYFFTERQTTAFAFSLFFFFENWLYTAVYMADARAMDLPLVTTGDPEFVKHDWNTIFTSLGVLPYDTTIAGIVRFGGWCGMIATVGWLVWRALRPVEERASVISESTHGNAKASTK